MFQLFLLQEQTDASISIMMNKNTYEISSIYTIQLVFSASWETTLVHFNVSQVQFVFKF